MTALRYEEQPLTNYSLFSQYGFRKPYNKLEEVVLAKDYGVSLSELGLSSVAAEKAGYKLVISPISKKRAGIWAKKSNLNYFDDAEAAIAKAIQESKEIKQELVEGKLNESREAIAMAARDMAESLGDPSIQIESIGKIQLRFDQLCKSLDRLLKRIESADYLEEKEKIHGLFSQYQGQLEACQESMNQSMSKELNERSQAFASIGEHIQEVLDEDDFVSEFIAWTDDERRSLTVRNSIETAAEFVCCSLENAGILQEYTPVLDTFSSDINKAHKMLEMDPLLDTVKRLLLNLKDDFSDEYRLRIHNMQESQEAEGKLPQPPQLSLRINQDIGFETLLNRLENSYKGLKDEGDFNAELSIDRETPWELNVHYKFQFKDSVEGYTCNFKAESHWVDNYKGPLSHKRGKNLALSLNLITAKELSSYEMLQAFFDGKNFPSADGLLKKRDKYLATCQFFVDQNMEKDGFHTFAQRHNAFACGSLKQAKNFKGILERRFADFSLARLSTSHADIFESRGDRRARNIIFYAGPTNSGKSYMAFEELAKHEKGAYLAPLRLLALEGVEELQKRGKKVSLVTGEERDLVDGATHISQTIETFDRESLFDCVIIDEIQMISDKGRGGAFMEALLNINADTVVLTGSDNSVEILREICSLTGDVFEVRRLERKNPLKWVGSFKVPKGPNADLKGTAIVAFSKKSIHMIRNHMLNSGYTVSVIYGALSPDVRRSEAERFRNGETDILVATDAIGMGLNLPIRRVLFSQSDKFDGERIRDLEATEVIQIGGRAGRYGMFKEEGEVGVVSGLTRFEVQESVVRDGFGRKLDEIDRVYVSITHRQLQDSYQTLNQELSSIIRTLSAKNKYTWEKARQAHMVDSERHEKAVLLEKSATIVAKEAGIDRSGTKALKKMEIPFPMIFRLLNTPFDVERYGPVLEESFENVLRAVMGRELMTQWIDVDTDPIRGSVALERSETNIKTLTLHYYFASYFESFPDSPYEVSPDEILMLRKEVGIQISHYLAKNETMEGVAGHKRSYGGRSNRGDKSNDSKNGKNNYKKRRRRR